MTPYAEQAEQAREFLESLKGGCWIQENNVAPFQLAEKNLYHKIQSELIEALDTLALVEAAVSEQHPTPHSIYGLGYEYCRDAVLKALEGE